MVAAGLSRFWTEYLFLLVPNKNCARRDVLSKLLSNALSGFLSVVTLIISFYSAIESGPVKQP